MAALARPFHAHPLKSPRSSRSLVVTLAVGTLHLVVIALLVKATYITIPNHPVARAIEIWFIFPPRPQPKAKPEPQSEKAEASTQITTETTVPDYSHITLPPSWGEKNMNWLNQSLFGCEPDQIALFSAEERAKCPSVAAASRDRDKDGVDYRDHTDRSKDRVHWARGRARKNLPLLLPCASPYSVGVSIATLLCLAKGAVEGFDPDNQRGYMDKPVIIRVPNNGDPSSIYEPGN